MPISRRSMFAAIAGLFAAPAVAAIPETYPISGKVIEVNGTMTATFKSSEILDHYKRGRPPLHFRAQEWPVDKNGIEYPPCFSLSQKGHVYVDGKKHNLVLEANEIEGYIVKYRKEGTGSIIVDEGGELVTDIVRGFVEVRTA